MATRRGQTRRDNQEQQDQQQETNGGDAGQALDQESFDNLQSQLSEAMQPVMTNLQQQLGDTVRNLAEQTGANQAGSEATSDEDAESEGTSVTGTVQSVYESVAHVLRSIWAWIVEMTRRFGDQVAEAIGNFVGLLVQRAIKSAF